MTNLFFILCLVGSHASPMPQNENTISKNQYIAYEPLVSDAPLVPDGFIGLNYTSKIVKCQDVTIWWPKSWGYIYENCEQSCCLVKRQWLFWTDMAVYIGIGGFIIICCCFIFIMWIVKHHKIRR